jgi:hypothetical protein
MGLKSGNFAVSKIANAGGIGTGDLSLSVTPGQGALFPSLSTGEYTYIVGTNSSGNREIMKVTARSTDDFTIVRAQEGTTALAYVQGDAVQFNLTDGILKEFRQLQVAKTSDFSLLASDLYGNYTFTNEGAAGEVIFSLPAGAAGMRCKFIVVTAQYLRVKANGTQKLRLGSDLTAAGGYVRNNVAGTTFEVEFVTTLDQWIITGAGLTLITNTLQNRHSKTLEIGDWNMETTASKAVAHGLTAAKIIDVRVTVRKDDDGDKYPLNYLTDGAGDKTAGTWESDANYVQLLRSTNGYFILSGDFSSTSYNRGWVIINYLD